MTASGIDNTLNSYDNVGNGKPSLMRGQHRQIISSGGATRKLTASESGATCLFDSAAGVVYTLPAPVVGMEFNFQTTVTITSNEAKVITETIASEFIGGGIISANATVAASGDFFTADGATHVAIAENGTTTGGAIGDNFTLTAVSSTLWLISGLNSGSGTNATPFATS